MKCIKLTQRKYATVDDEDFAYLNQWKWFYHDGYVLRNLKRIKGKNQKKISMHRLIAQTPNDMYTDHINGNGLDNRRNNLRICTNQQNGMNRKVNINNTSGYKGVSWHKKGKKWQVQIKAEKFLYLGLFKSKIQAAKAYNQKALKLFGEYANLNEL